MASTPKSGQKNKEKQQKTAVSAYKCYNLRQKMIREKPEVKAECGTSQMGDSGRNPNSEGEVVGSGDINLTAQGITIQQSETKVEGEKEENQLQSEVICTSKRYNTRQRAKPTIKSDRTQETVPGNGISHLIDSIDQDTGSKEEVDENENTLVCDGSSTNPSQEMEKNSLQVKAEIEDQNEEDQQQPEGVSSYKCYETRQKTNREKVMKRSMIDWKRTNRNSISRLIDSNDLNTSSEEDVDEDENLSGSESSSTSSSQGVKDMDQQAKTKFVQGNETNQQQIEVVSEEEREKEAVVPTKRKKKTSVMNSSDSASDSDVTLGKVSTKRRHVIEDDEKENEPNQQQIQVVSEEEKDEEPAVPVKRKKKTSFMNSSDSGSDRDVTPGKVSTKRRVVSEEEGEEEAVVPTKHKKTSFMNSSDSGSDSDIAPGKVSAKGRHVIEDDDSVGDNKETSYNDVDDSGEGSKNTPLNKDDYSTEIEESSEDEALERRIKRRRNRKNLERLAEKRRSRSRSNNYDDDFEDENSPVGQAESNEDHNSMDDFIVDDEDTDGIIDEGVRQSTHKNLFVKHHINMHVDLDSHLSRVIKALLINAADETFLTSLYEGKRMKRYAKEMLDSLDYLDSRTISPRLVNLSTRSKWNKRYKDRVECYPELNVYEVTSQNQRCDACGLQRYCKYQVILSGELYDSKTFEKDDFLPNDEQEFVVGKVCARRTEVYHQLKHFKYRLYQQCKEIIEVMPVHQMSTKELVKRCFSTMEKDNFIHKNVNDLEAYLDEADFFQSECID
uniref:DUF4211 domain-containing protein n=1 Tax=Leptobrachium leishanense TaxID=445787 RepID=A0A8C5P6Z7_9ANUR